MEITKELIKEHIEIRKITDIMCKISEDIKGRRIFYTNDIEKIVEYIVSFWDKCHREKEEIVLFPAISAELEQNQKNTTLILIDEHAVSSNYIKEITRNIENCKIGNPFSSDQLANCLSTCATMLQMHIQYEENELYPFANRIISVEKKHQILKHFELIDFRLKNKGYYDRYRENFIYLKEKYLN